jgi:hypothetical protein
MREIFLADVATEVLRAQAMHPVLNSAHEAYAVILEELDEYWQEVKRKRQDQNHQAMYNELVQIAAMAARAAIDTL